jgi:histidinol phosphatase-like PHP family hydrolase
VSRPASAGARLSWQPVDCHCHSTFSDGWLTPEKVAAAARKRGVVPSVTDHVSTAAARWIATVPALRAYLDALEGAGVLRGAEFCWHDPLWRAVPGEVRARFTHTLGSLHAIFLDGGRVLSAGAARAPGLTVRAYMDALLHNVERLAREMPVDVLAHPTLVVRPLRRVDPEELWTEAREERLVEALFRAGIAFELSALRPAHERLVRRAADRGVRLALGSDGHLRHEVASVARPLAMARRLRVPDATLYDPRVHGTRAHTRSPH